VATDSFVGEAAGEEIILRAGRNVIDFAHYDDGDGTLGNVGVARYGVHYVYKHIDDDDVYVVYGTDSYTLAEAEIAAIIPPTIPNHLTDFGCLIGAIIAPQAGGSFTAVIMVTSQFFSGTEVANHANLANLDYASSGHTGFANSGANSNITSLTGLTTPLGAAYGGTGVANNAANTLTFTGAYSLGLTLTANTAVTLPTSGTLLANVLEDTTPELGGEMDSGAHTIGFTQQTVSYNSTTTTVDWKLSNKASMTFGAGNIGTFAFTNPTNPCNVLLMLIQDGTGSRTVTAWDADILWASGSAPTLSTAANAVDIVTFYWNGTKYYGVASLDFK